MAEAQEKRRKRGPNASDRLKELQMYLDISIGLIVSWSDRSKEDFMQGQLAALRAVKAKLQ